jgi:creatinine amidohydrolase/Fe(II)-dependent formamide hydrolase-like protein
VDRLADLGAKRVVLMTFHGSPLHSHALQAGVDALAKRGVHAIAPLNIALAQQARGRYENVEEAWMPVEDEALRAALRADVAVDFHAGFVETSLSLHYAPETVGDHRELPPCPPIVPQRTPKTLARFARAAGLESLGVELDVLARGLAWYALRPFPGYTGRPHLANPESGAVFARAIVAGFAEASLAVFDGAKAPRPIMEWMKLATLGGRVGAVDVPLEAVGLPG